jgi:hypothetical protein
MAATVLSAACGGTAVIDGERGAGGEAVCACAGCALANCPATEPCCRIGSDDEGEPLCGCSARCNEVCD